MIDWEVASDHLRVADGDGVELRVTADIAAVDTVDGGVPRPVDETIAFETATLRLPQTVGSVETLDGTDRFALDGDEEPFRLSDGAYVLDANAAITTHVRFDGAATIRRDGRGRLVLSFPEERRVLLGFRSLQRRPVHAIETTADPAGLAAAMEYLSVAIKTDRPERTFPTLRGHPALLSIGEERSIPDALRDRRDGLRRNRDPIELVVPDTFEAVYAAAPLAYFLGASTRVSERSTGRLRIPDHGIDLTLPELPAMERRVEELLRRVFFFDCLVRNEGTGATPLSEGHLLEVLELDAEGIYERPLAERVATYLEVPHAAVAHRLPDWHLSTYVEPTAASLETIPYLLDRLSLIYRPRTSELEGRELMERSLEDFYRGPRAGAGQVASVEMVKPELRGGRVHGWLAEGVPIDVFKSTPEAYRNRLDHLDRTSEAVTVRVVLNDPDMAGEHDHVANIYGDRAEDIALDLTVEESLGVADLARCFEAETDFVHYIGHCETDGLRCPDGYLDCESIDRSGAQTYFLNACGSYYEGLALVERGSVAGGVTFTQVLNEHALKVGSTFARLLVHGFSFERALRLARRRIMMGKDYAVVGDGTHTLTAGVHRLPMTVEVEKLEEEFLVTLDCFSTGETGAYYVPRVPENDFGYLCGTKSSFALERAELAAFLREASAPVIYDGDITWSTELGHTLEN